MKRMLKLLLIAALLAGPRPLAVKDAIAAVTATDADIAAYYAAGVEYEDGENGRKRIWVYTLDSTAAAKFDGANAGDYLIFHDPKGVEIIPAASFAARFTASERTLEAGYIVTTALIGTGTIDETPFFRATKALTLVGCFITPGAAIGAANNTNYRSIIIKRYSASGGSGATVVTATSQVGGVLGGAGQFDETSLGTLSNTSLATGEILTVQSTIAAGGLILPVSHILCAYSFDPV